MAVTIMLVHMNLKSGSQCILEAGAVQQVIFLGSAWPAEFNLEGGPPRRSSGDPKMVARSLSEFLPPL